MPKTMRIPVIFFVSLLFVTPVNGYAQEDVVETPELMAEAAILMEAQSGQILYSKNADQPMYPASITKILTGIIAIESGKLDDVVTVSQNAFNAGGTRVYLEVGEQKELRDLVYGLLVNSGNDAAVAIAEHLGGTVEGFAKMMNEKARELGAENSHFVNPSGMPHEEHVTTARDMARITRYAMNNDTFREVVGTKEYAWEGDGWQPGSIVNHNRLLWDYEGATGVKNGYTDAAQLTLVASSEREGQQLIGVALKVPGTADNIYRDMTALMDYGFDVFETYAVDIDSDLLTTVNIEGVETPIHVNEEQYFVTLPKEASVQDLEQTISLDNGTSLPVAQKEQLGYVRLSYQGEVLRDIPVLATTSVPAPRAEVKQQVDSAGFPWLAWLASLLVFSCCLLYFYKRHRRRRQTRARLQAYRSYRG